MRSIIVTTVLAFMTGCPQVEEAKQVDPKPEPQIEEKTPATAMMIIQQYHDGLAANCGKGLPDVKKTEELAKLEIPAEDQEKADKLLADLGLMAQQCASDYAAPTPKEGAESCDPSCHWCPVKWYWCIENAGACAGGDNEACCKLGACGSKHHCKQVCESSCGCNVPPLPSDGGGSGED